MFSETEFDQAAKLLKFTGKGPAEPNEFISTGAHNDGSFGKLIDFVLDEPEEERWRYAIAPDEETFLDVDTIERVAATPEFLAWRDLGLDADPDLDIAE